VLFFILTPCSYSAFPSYFTLKNLNCGFRV
jgi:hypothetical protein